MANSHSPMVRRRYCDLLSNMTLWKALVGVELGCRTEAVVKGAESVALEMKYVRLHKCMLKQDESSSGVVLEETQDQESRLNGSKESAINTQKVKRLVEAMHRAITTRERRRSSFSASPAAAAANKYA